MKARDMSAHGWVGLTVSVALTMVGSAGATWSLIGDRWDGARGSNDAPIAVSASAERALLVAGLGLLALSAVSLIFLLRQGGGETSRIMTAVFGVVASGIAIGAVYRLITVGNDPATVFAPILVAGCVVGSVVAVGHGRRNVTRPGTTALFAVGGAGLLLISRLLLPTTPDASGSIYPIDFENVRKGQAASVVRAHLGAPAPTRGYVGRFPVPPKGLTCVFYVDGFQGEVSAIYRICFRGGRVAEKSQADGG